MQSKKWMGRAAALLILAGLVISLYLFIRGNKLSSEGTANSDFCSAVFQKSCDGTLQSEYSHMLGLSVAGWGVVYFATLAALLGAGSMMRDVFLRPAVSVALLANFIGLGISGYLGWLLLSGTVSLCPLCLATHAINLLLFVALLLYRGENPLGFLKDVGAGMAWVLAPGQKSAPEYTLRTVSFTAVALFAAVTWLGLSMNSPSTPTQVADMPGTTSPSQTPPAAPSGAEKNVQDILDDYAHQKLVSIPVSDADGRIGSADAPVQIVVFNDFQCSSCKANALMLDRLVQAYGDRLSIVTKEFPLSSTCNNVIATNPHEFACPAAYAGVAAQMQQKYWAFRGFVYRLKEPPSPEALLKAAEAAGLDLDRFRKDMESDAAKAKVAEDIQLGKGLNVQQTPWIFMNGRLLTGKISAQIPLLVEALSDKDKTPSVDQVIQNIVQAYLDQEVVDIPVGSNDPRSGPAEAPAQLVIFSDFECPSCKDTSHVIRELAKAYSGRLSIVTKNFPLSSTCNPSITTNRHKEACNAAYGGVAAHMQGKFWPFHELVYGLKGAPTPQALAQCARAAGMDVPRFLADLDSDLAKTKVAEDINLGIKLKVIQTPTMYLNGRMLTASTAPQIPLLIDRIVAEATKKSPAPPAQ